MSYGSEVALDGLLPRKLKGINLFLFSSCLVWVVPSRKRHELVPVLGALGPKPKTGHLLYIMGTYHFH